ncbi:hypothetical protein MNEG_16126 [Monoraphidium neglectum]|uniref:F-box domain-containing protein n=1 Tax=Monoraphidium neglectum TaxID=145388 RepID=A0A0D2IV43_9CHLO|nr:hypothetical protein MNEG_16126 [Monoraphidium neglectum]KIY91837.1 hypothetical protein MNEG_16126 [Monoraphidium neglectum]|eukprot:XP_013890857.1 hypothetical protein MNEG_16126 [Monoraphidium neglectum]
MSHINVESAYKEFCDPSPLWPFGGADNAAALHPSIAAHVAVHVLATLRPADKRSLRAVNRACRALVNASAPRLRVTTAAGFRALCAAARGGRLPALRELERDARGSFSDERDLLLAAPLPRGLGGVTALVLRCGSCHARVRLQTKTVKAMVAQLGALPALRRLEVWMRDDASSAKAATVIKAAAKHPGLQVLRLPSTYAFGKGSLALSRSLARGAWQQLQQQRRA